MSEGALRHDLRADEGTGGSQSGDQCHGGGAVVMTFSTTEWDGRWPTAMDLPEPGEVVTFHRTTRQGVEAGTGTVAYCWCGIEPAITLTDGRVLFPTLSDTWARV